MTSPRTYLRVAAIGDIHVSRHTQGSFQTLFTQISSNADVLVLCGDFTDYGLPDEARILARELTAAVKVPVIAVLGNHDYEGGKQHEIRQILSDAGVTLLDGEATVPYTVAGSYAFQYYAGILRTTKDFDIFARPWDVRRVLEVLTRTGFKTEIAFAHWLAKAHHGDKFIDVIHNSGNGVAEVDDEWFAHAVDEEVLGVPVKLTPAEEMIWSKAMIMERERFDGADVAHLFRHCSGLLDWDRLVRRFGSHWRVLLSHLLLFGFIYPGERALIPATVMKELVNRLLADLDVPTRDSKMCQGTLLSRSQYLVDIDEWGYEDARVARRGSMTEEQIAEWTAAIDKSH